MRGLVSVVILGALLGLSACNQAAVAPPTPKSLLFPALGASPYVADYTLGEEKTATTMRIARSGASQRMERSMGPAGHVGVMLVDGASGKMYSFQTGEGVPKAALLIQPDKLGALKDTLDIEAAAKVSPPKHLGSDTVAGLGCEVWEMGAVAAPAAAAVTAAGAAQIADAGGRQVCVTHDGIMLRVQAAGAAVPELVATSVTRGPQDAALFALPEGYAVVDMSECMNAGAAMMAAVKAGKKPDMSLMQKCQGMSKLMGGS